jgi:hypothetical protein
MATGGFDTEAAHIQMPTRRRLAYCGPKMVLTKGSTLTYAEIKAIASGNPAVVEKIKIDTEVRKLDQLRAVHADQQRHIRWESRDLPRQITEAKQHLACIEGDIATRNATEPSEFAMTVGNRVFRRVSTCLRHLEG